jgi:hypothetical protein
VTPPPSLMRATAAAPVATACRILERQAWSARCSVSCRQR